MPGRLIAVGTHGHYFAESSPGRYQFTGAGITAPISGDLFDDWVPLAHAILAEAEIIQRERDQR